MREKAKPSTKMKHNPPRGKEKSRRTELTGKKYSHCVATKKENITVWYPEVSGLCPGYSWPQLAGSTRVSLLALRAHP